MVFNIFLIYAPSLLFNNQKKNERTKTNASKILNMQYHICTYAVHALDQKPCEHLGTT